jgi:hypothetical protein
MNAELDLQSADSIRFLPWVGERYGPESRFHMNVLVLGESHYGTDRDYSRTLTRDLTDEFVRGCWNHRFWTGIGQVLAGKPYWEFPRRDIWEHIAFYNYVQYFAADGPRVPPSAEMWGQSERAFRQLLRLLQPQFLLVLGERLWSYLPKEDQPGKGVRVESLERDTCLYSVGGSRFCLAGRIWHPSAAFSWQRWYPWVQAYLSEVLSYNNRLQATRFPRA